MAAERDRAEAELLASFSLQEQRLLRDLLTRLTAGRPAGHGTRLHLTAG